MVDKDIKELFYKKNQEIIVNKLLLDLDNNIDSLLATMDNIIYLEFAIYKEKIVSLDYKRAKQIKNLIEKYSKYLKDKFRVVVSLKKDKCSDYLKNKVLDHDISQYKKILNQTTKKIEDELLLEISVYLEEKIKRKLPIDCDNSNLNKLSFFLDQKLTNDIVDKLISQLLDRDIIIYNNAQESYQKYLTLNDNIK